MLHFISSTSRPLISTTLPRPTRRRMLQSRRRSRRPLPSRRSATAPRTRRPRRRSRLPTRRRGRSGGRRGCRVSRRTPSRRRSSSRRCPSLAPAKVKIAIVVLLRSTTTDDSYVQATRMITRASGTPRTPRATLRRLWVSRRWPRWRSWRPSRSRTPTAR